jgi:hypothetical protein
LKASGFPDSEIAYAPIIKYHHVLTAWNAMIASFKSLGWFVQNTTGVPRIGARSRLENVPVLSVWLSQFCNGIANSAPRLRSGPHRICA